MKRIAFPSSQPGGLDAALSPHFGHCDVFTLIEFQEDQVQSVELIPNGGHEQGGCMAPVMLLKRAGAEALVAGGMGMRPLAGFQQVGIDVYFSEGASTVKDAVSLILANKARKFGPAQTCQGGGGGCGSH